MRKLIHIRGLVISRLSIDKQSSNPAADVVLKNQPWDLLDERGEQGIEVVAKKKTRTPNRPKPNQPELPRN